MANNATPANASPREGEISVSTQNIFPVIKKWLYSERDIFLRELVSNACDAITKLNRLISLGEAELDNSALGGEPSNEAFSINVSFDKDAKTLTIRDNGIGMSEDEVREYLCEIALSGALKFIEKYESKDSAGAGIIGHFGLGFYSAFMVADTVEVVTRSYTDAPAVSVIFREDGKYSVLSADGAARGTSIILHVTDEASEYLDEFRLRGILMRYCRFMPYPIYLDDENADTEPNSERIAINNTTPLWDKTPSEIDEKAYNDFYAELFSDYREPLFHVHIKADYPLNFRGVLYFPRLRDGFDSYEGQVKLYYNHVFVADNIKEILPDYLVALRGVIDCPELPLNVSRSYLQNDAYAKKVAAHIAKKVSDTLVSLAANERTRYAGIWRDIKLFIEFGASRDEKFYDRIKPAILFERADEGSPLTLEEYFAARNADEASKGDKTVYYATDKIGQAVQIDAFFNAKIPVILLDRGLDTQFIETVERHEQGVKFLRIDAASESLKDSSADADWADEGVKSAFAAAAPEGTDITFAPLLDANIGVLLEVSEAERRIEDMMKMYGQAGDAVGGRFKLIINSNSPLIRALASSDEGLRALSAKSIYLLALPALRPLNAEEWRELNRVNAEIIQMKNEEK
jgi:molecular chaperone HtpG